MEGETSHNLPEGIEHERARLLAAVLAVIDKHEQHYRWGGNEDDQGRLLPAEPDFDLLRDEVREAIIGA